MTGGAIRRLGALGTLVWDRIWHPVNDGAHPGPREQWGGMTYSLAALSACCPPGWRVEPVMRVGRDLEEEARALLAGLPDLHAGEGVRLVAEPNNRVELRYRDAANRHERLTGGVSAWDAAELLPLIAPLDALYVNFISGFELGLETARAVRDRHPGPLYADLHSLFLGPAGEQPRAPRPLPRWEEWLACFDAVQLNEAELALLLGEGEPEALAARLVSYGPGLVAVTLGAGGACLAWRDDLPADPLRWRDAGAAPPAGTRTLRVAPPAGALEGDPTGCGDVWGGSFFTGLLAGLPLHRAAARAHRLAAEKIRHPETATLAARLRQACRAGAPTA